MSSVTAVTSESFDDEVGGSDVPVLVEYWATWCAPCRAMAPVLESLAAEHEGDLKVVKIDVEHEAALADAARIEGLPTLLLYQGGREVRRLVGARSRLVLEMELGLYQADPAA